MNRIRLYQVNLKRLTPTNKRRILQSPVYVDSDVFQRYQPILQNIAQPTEFMIEQGKELEIAKIQKIEKHDGIGDGIIFGSTVLISFMAGMGFVINML